MTRLLPVGIALSLLVACGSDPDAAPTSADVGLTDTIEADAGPTEDTSVSDCPAESVEVGGIGAKSLEGVGGCSVALVVNAPTLVEINATDVTSLGLVGAPDADEPSWVPPHVLAAGTHALEVEAPGAWSIDVQSFGAPVAEIERERSLVWIDPAIVDDTTVVGLGRLMAAAANGGNGGELLAAWFGRFATTSHSERVGPVQFLEELQATHGADPSLWDLDALPFVVTAVHNRNDLADDTSCGQLRVSLASTHTVFQPFHAIFLFEQPALPDDISPGGQVHCGGTERRWARLSELEDAPFRSAAASILDAGLTSERFIIAETVEFMISPWEWRQWAPRDNAGAGPERVFENPPLFQTVDTARLNTPSTLRDDFLRFVEDNAAGLDARQLLIPERFRPPSARVNDGIPWVPLDLSGVDNAVLGQFPDLRKNIEIVGCPACHVADADFVQTRADRTFSPFYDKELDARAEYLDLAQRGVAPPVPFGPLQAMPELTP